MLPMGATKSNRSAFWLVLEAAGVLVVLLGPKRPSSSSIKLALEFALLDGLFCGVDVPCEGVSSSKSIKLMACLGGSVEFVVCCG